MFVDMYRGKRVSMRVGMHADVYVLVDLYSVYKWVCILAGICGYT